jgi:predicted RNA-binding Zn-ribbon protein involved in translation (DUF1610 family)
MGMFDTVYVECPGCGEEVEMQTKTGPCLLGQYSLDSAPPEVLLGVANEPECCPECFEEFIIRARVFTRAWTEKFIP